MVNIEQNLIERDLKHVWHPCSQMKDFEQCPPFIIKKAKGCYLHTNHGKLIDSISSWWCKSLGHAHPSIMKAIQKQLKQFEHVISANTTHDGIVRLSELLSTITRKQHAFFASDGSCAVEIAMKLALHAKQIKGQSQRNQFIALENAYHGETLATLSVSDVGLYKAPYKQFGLPCHFIQDLPYVSGNDDPLWHDCEEHWKTILPTLERLKEHACAVLVEPILQGAGGMKCYSADFLKKLSHWAKKNDIFLIADEIMTGIGRTGHWLACQHADIDPDIICLSKGLTSGTLPLSCAMIDHSIYTLFYDDYTSGKSFLHSHTYSGHPLAIHAAIATLEVIQQESILEHSKQLGAALKHHFEIVAEQTNRIKNIRALGAWVAGDLEVTNNQRVGYQIYQEALNNGLFIRPLGNTLYWLPPLIADEALIGKLAKSTLHSINKVYERLK